MFGAVPVGRDKPDGPWKSDRVLRASRGSPQTLIPPEFRKPIRCQRSVSGRRLQIAMAEIMRQRAGILPIIGELLNVSACADELETETSRPDRLVGPFVGTKLGSPECQLQ